MAEEGCGKSMFLRQIMLTAHEHWKLITLTGSPTIALNTLFSALRQALKLDDEGNNALITQTETLRAAIAAARFNGEIPILLVDDAHMLPLETLHGLIHLSMIGAPHTRLRLLMGCEPQITSLFATPEFEVIRNSLIHTLDLPPLNREQSARFIREQLTHAGYSSPYPFTDDTLEQIYCQAEGVPAQINRLARERLTHYWQQTQNNPQSSSRTWVKWVGSITISALFAVLIAWWLMWLPQRPLSQAGVSVPRVLSLPPKEQPQLPFATSIEPPNSPQQRIESAPEPPPTQPTAVLPQPTALSESANKQAPTAQPTVQSAQWLLSLPEDAYTIQLMGTYEPRAIDNFMQSYPLSAPLAIFQTRYQNRPWYVLVCGVYASQTQAAAAREALPLALRRHTQPWVRTLRSVQENIQNTQQE